MELHNLITVASIMLLSACSSMPENSVAEPKNEIDIGIKIDSLKPEDFEIIEIDGCEYVIYKSAPASNIGFGFMAHKGNCKNPMHIYSSSVK